MLPLASLLTTHSAVHWLAEPLSVTRLQAGAALQLCGQLLGGSHFSPGSTTLFPHCALQSLSLVASQPLGQQPSPSSQAVIALCRHCAEQVPPLSS